MTTEVNKKREKKKVAVIGGGFAGMTAALQLAEQGLAVTLVEKEVAIGGFFPLLDNTFPTNSCGVCFLSPKQPAYCPFVECRLHDNLEIKVGSRPVALQGQPGDFNLTLAVDPQGVDQEKCIDCGDCVEVCPVTVPYEFSDGLEERKAVYKLYPKMVKAGYRIDLANCTKCGACVTACPTQAIDLDAATFEEEITADAVLLTPGFSLVEGGLKGEYGFGRYKNVVTSRQLERMISFSGPSQGKPISPADGTTPKKVAFIQCVGSRDVSCGRGYCSSVCCMYATKQAMFIRERCPETEVVIYYMDLRGMGKGYEKYFNQAKDEHAVEYRRSMISTVKEDPKTRKLNLVYDDGQGFTEDAVDLVVLSLGFDAPKIDFAADLGLELDEYGFCQTQEFTPTITSVPGLFAAGAFCGPKDIPETVMEAAAAADAVAVSLAAAKNETSDLETQTIQPQQGEVWIDEPKIGIFLCSCAGTMADELDLPGLCSELKERPYVACAEVVDNSCTPQGLLGLRKFIGEHELNRIVIGACSVRDMERSLDAFADEIGFNRNAFVVANLREQCFFPHQGAPEVVQSKAKALLAAALTQVFRNLPAPLAEVAVEPRALVVGGGVAGLNASLSLAARGYQVTLVEKEGSLGGRLLKAHYTLEGSQPAKLLAELIPEVEADANIEVLLEAKIVEHQGRVGNYTTLIRTGESEQQVKHGVLLLATGGNEADTDEYLKGQNEKVLTQSELEERLATAPESLNDCREVVMIQCVGSRESGKREYCSRVCCTHALKNALRLKEIAPEIKITVLYRDLRAYGLFEEYYRQARELGILFSTYEVERKPEAAISDSNLTLKYYDQVLRKDITLNPDLLILSTGIVPGDFTELAEIFSLPLDDYGFFAEANSKAALVDFVGEGRYHCGLASAPLHIKETLIRSRAAASRAATVLARKHISADKSTVMVSTRLCSGCGLCVDACPYGAREINLSSMIAEIHYELCHGCGSCAAVCPNGATQQIGFDKGQMMAVANALMR
ncbi:MAG: CoB--CoM heterodisulfide reductase iron-sulfur subunit A family protein [Deltaproteobacteria bacterium]|nr:CoB--CoM heterodisulfide reductase iron-sulfur subunit A family protein [Candidatus Tharpella aukensis]